MVMKISDRVLEELRQAAERTLSPHRYEHTIGCMNEAVRLAKGRPEDLSVLKAAALLHDITKECSPEDHLKLCKKWDIIIPETAYSSPAVLHQYTGAAVAEHIYGMPPEVCRAIAAHTTGSGHMTETDRLLFLADLTEPGREIARDPHVCRIREMAERNTVDACIEQLEYEIKRLTRLGREVCYVTCEAYESLKRMKSEEENKA